jgi:glycosyltransferase involved in cell wall biosynthesis
MDKIQVFVISSARPPEKSAAAITLARHLEDKSSYEVQCLPSESHELLEPEWLKRFFQRVEKTRFARWVRDLRYLAAAFLPLHMLLPNPKRNHGKSVVMTVACGNGWLTAAKYARQHSIPLAVRFDDWWPDTLDLHSPLRTLYARQFEAMSKTADVCFCISNGMQKELGNRAHSEVVLPIPEAGREPRLWRASENPFRVCYLGNMFDYGSMLGELAGAAAEIADVRLEFRGTEPNWPNDLKVRMRSSGQLHGFLEGDDFQCWYESFDCYLVAMFFEQRQRRRVRTCFATKLLDYSAMGRPIVIWAPEESAVVVWARKSGAAVCVTSPDAGAVVAALQKLAADPVRCRELGERARAAYETDFNPDRLKQVFDDALVAAVR